MSQEPDRSQRKSSLSTQQMATHYCIRTTFWDPEDVKTRIHYLPISAVYGLSIVESGKGALIQADGAGCQGRAELSPDGRPIGRLPAAWAPWL
jgi:hypothetical protein